MKYDPVFHFKAFHGEQRCRTCEQTLHSCFCRPGMTRKVKLTPAASVMHDWRFPAPVRRENVRGEVNFILLNTPDGETRWLAKTEIPVRQPSMAQVAKDENATYRGVNYVPSGQFLGRSDGEVAELYIQEATAHRVVFTVLQWASTIHALEVQLAALQKAPQTPVVQRERQSVAEALHILREMYVEVNEDGEETNHHNVLT